MVAILYICYAWQRPMAILSFFQSRYAVHHHLSAQDLEVTKIFPELLLITGTVLSSYAMH